MTLIYQRGSIGENDGRAFNFVRADGKPAALAGLWESFVWPDGRIERSFCIVTIAANELMAPIHDRMPVVLEEPDWALWLGEVEGDPASLLRRPPAGVLRLEETRSGRRGGARRHV